MWGESVKISGEMMTMSGEIMKMCGEMMKTCGELIRQCQGRPGNGKSLKTTTTTIGQKCQGREGYRSASLRGQETCAETTLTNALAT